MLNRIIDYSVNNKLLVGLMTITLIVVGIYQVTKLPIDAVPDITDNQVQIITVAPAYGAIDIERLVTFQIEQACSNISGTKEIRSFSRFGLSLVTIVFEDNIDVYWARQQVSERLQIVTSLIPKDIGIPTLGPISSGLGEIYQYVVKPKKGFESKYSTAELRTIQDWIIRRQLLGAKGVAEVSSFGGKLKQFEVLVSPSKLNALHISIEDIFTALEANNHNTGGAYIEKGPTVLYIRTEGLIKSIDDIENITIKNSSNPTPIYLRDVAEVKIGHATRYGAICYNGDGEVAGGIIMMLKGENSSQVIKDVKERIVQIAKTLPEGVEIEPFLDRTKMVNNAINTVQTNLLEGALIVVFILVIFLGNLKAGLIVSSVIPLSMLFAISMMNLFGVSGNLMSLGALDFGLIVDGAVIIVEAILHYLGTKKFKDKLTQSQMDDTVKSSAKKMMNSAVFGQAIILIVYLPIFTLEGIEGKMFKPMAQTVSFALLGAFILSLTYIPMMSSLFLSKKHSALSYSDRMMAKIENKFSYILNILMDFPKLVLSFVFTLFLLSLFILSSLGGEFIPALEEGDFAVDTRVLTGSNLTTTIKYTQMAAKLLKDSFPEVEKVVTKIGSGEVPTDPMPMEASDMMVILKDKSKWTSAKTFPELERKMSKKLEDIPGITAGFQFPVQMRFNELMTGARQDVVCKIFGENLDSLSHIAEKLGAITADINGAENIYVEPIDGLPQIVIEYRREDMARFGINIKNANNVVNTALAGQSSGQIFEDEKRFDLVVRLHQDEKMNLQDIGNLLISSKDNVQIPLSQIANVEIKNGINQIQREDAKRRIIVGFNVGNRDVQSIVHDLKTKVEEKLNLPSGYYITYGGAFENLEKAKSRLLIAVPISLIFIFILLYFAFNSVKHGILIYSAIPLSAIGGIIFLSIRGMSFSISAGIGFIALFGVAVLNGIVLIAEYNKLKADGHLQSIKDIVIQGTIHRLRPVLMTACVASIGFLPMALSNGAGAEVQRPLATVVIGGLLFATMLTLFVLPILYVLFESKIKIKMKSHINTFIAFVLTVISPSLNAQESINFEQALNLMDKSNILTNSHKTSHEIVEQNLKTYKVIPKTGISTEIGQVNSALFDSKISLSQNLAWPTIHKAQKEFLVAEKNKTVSTNEVSLFKLKKYLTEYFIIFHHNNLLRKVNDAKKILLEKLLAISDLRNKSGIENAVNSLALKSQLSQLKSSEKDLALQQNICEENVNLILNNTSNMKIFADEIFDLSTYAQLRVVSNPLLKLSEQEVELAKAIKKLEASKLLPDIVLGINNTSFRGVGPDNKSYNASNRFTSAQVGILLPLFDKSQKMKVKVSELNVNLAEEEKQIVHKTLEMQNRVNELNLASIIEKINLIEESINLIDQSISIATKEYELGEVTFAEISNLLDQKNQLEMLKIEAWLAKNTLALNNIFQTLN